MLPKKAILTLRDIHPSTLERNLLPLTPSPIRLPNDEAVHTLEYHLDKKLDLTEQKSSWDLLFRHRPLNFLERVRSLITSPQRRFYFLELRQFGALAVSLVITLTLTFAALSGLELKDAVQSQAEMGMSQLLQGVEFSKNNSFTDASQSIAQAEFSFEKATEQLSNLAFLSLHENIPDSQLTLADTFTRIGQDISKLVGEYLKVMDAVKLELPKQITAMKNGMEAERPAQSITDSLAQLAPVMKKGTETLLRIYGELSEMQNRTDLPPEIQNNLEQAAHYVTLLYTANKQGQQALPTLLELLGHKAPHRYLILFQNNHEIRPTGGFIGSYLQVTVQQGSIKEFDFHDIYDMDGQVSEIIKAPEGLNHITPLFSLRDANYYPDFPESAQKIVWFYEGAGGDSVDTVIAIDQEFLYDLLALIGPVDLPGYPITLDGTDIVVNGERFVSDRDGLSLVFSYIVESHLENSATPKNLLKNLIPIIAEGLEKNAAPEQLLTLLSFEKSRKQLQAYSRINEVQSFIEDYGLDGKLKETSAPTDYAMIVDTSISGNKSSFSQHITHQTTISPEGTINDQLQIFRKHFWDNEKDRLLTALMQALGTKKLEQAKLTEILGKGAFKTYLRIYLPSKVTFSHISGLEELKIEENVNGKTVVAGYPPALAVGSEQFIKLEYKLPLPLPPTYQPTYQFVLQKQAGRREDSFTKIFAGENIEIVKTEPIALMDPEASTATWTASWGEDREVGVEFKSGQLNDVN